MAIHHSKVVSTVNRLRIWTGDSFDTAPSYNTSPSFLALRLRGGGAIEGAAAGFPTVGSINLGKALPVVGAALLAGFTITIVEKVPRSGGHAPSSVTAFLGHLGIDKVGSTGLFHLAYFLHCFVVLAVMPQGLKEVVFSPTGTLLLGTIFPLVESIKTAARSNDKSDAVSRSWLMYWVMHGTFSYASQDASRTIARFGPSGGKHWYEFQFYMVLWLILPFTDGAAIIYEMITRPYVAPAVAPIARMAEGWLTTLALAVINASHLSFVAFFFMALPAALKRLAVVATGTVYPVAATIVTVATDNEDSGGDKWLTYWSCFSLLNLGMISAERCVGMLPGLYPLCLALTFYLMLPLFDGSTAMFRDILVPLFHQREALLMKDARTLARKIARQLPVERHAAASKAAAAAFLEEVNKE